ncbi:MAG: LysR family transcriptional regulator [Telmatospirillum sp.]|nr:LysR family transcriptional regulator [Telmatospirillum sp.]
MTALDIQAVQAFLLVAELKSFTRAAEALETTQSAISLRIRRLETSLGRRLLERTPRQVRLSAEGSRFLEPARELMAAHRSAIDSFGGGRRRLVVGLSHHVIGRDLPVLLKRLGDAEPALTLEMHVGSSREVLDDYDAGTYDAAIVLNHDRHRHDGEVLGTEAFGWMAAPDFHPLRDRPLPLAAQAKPCMVRTMATSALDAAGLPWEEVFVGGGVGTVGAAVSAGLAVAALGRRFAPPGTADAGPRLGLPPLPDRDIVFFAKAGDRQTRADLARLKAALRGRGI